MEGEPPKGGQWTAAMQQDSYTDLQEKLERAQRERDEALEREKATADVLRVLSSSPGELQPVFATMLGNARCVSARRSSARCICAKEMPFESLRSIMLRLLLRRSGGANRYRARVLGPGSTGRPEPRFDPVCRAP
jgi:hypothetical protein